MFAHNSKINTKKYCPLCKHLLILKNDLLFCSFCNIYIGKVESFNISFNFNNHYFQQNYNFPHKKEEKEKSIRHVFLNYTIIFIVIFLLLFFLLEYFYKPYIYKIQKQEQLKLNKNL